MPAAQAKHSDEAALFLAEHASATLKRALANVYPGDPAHTKIWRALKQTNDAIAYMKRLRDNQ